MKTKPILFSTPMVQAILNGTKTQTRRVLKPQPKETPNGLYFDAPGCKLSNGNLRYSGIHTPWNDKPYGQVGDVLWVREKFRILRHCDTKEIAGYEFIAGHEEFYKVRENQMPKVKWKPSIHMPKEACRLFLQIKSIRVERLNDITETDAIAEGIERINPEGMMAFRSYAVKHDTEVFPIVSFHTLWQKINGPTSWVKNSFVWVIEFEQIEKPKDFLLK
ncbi:hypothetical protein [Flavobacterium sp. 25HG05S-40]|uniref:hypothetical protein n=1 Tax=Flavobacterium sp. 25HG05S-40 TaxID=3458682 RepID=UPI004044A279